LKQLPLGVMIEPHSEHSGASSETGAKGRLGCGSGSVGRSLGASPGLQDSVVCVDLSDPPGVEYE